MAERQKEAELDKSQSESALEQRRLALEVSKIFVCDRKA